MATIDEDNDIYNVGGGGGSVETGAFLEGDGTAESPLDVKPLPTETSSELNYALMDCLSMVKIEGTGNEKPKLMWAKFPIVVKTNAREDFSPYENNDIVAAPAWTSSTNPLLLNNNNPIVIDDWKYYQGQQHTAEIRMTLGYYDVLKRFHSGSRKYTLFKTSFIQNSANDGKFLKCVRQGSYMELVWETLQGDIFEVYIDEDDPSNNRNVVYNDILNAVNSGKYVYLKVKDNNGDYVFYSLTEIFSNAVNFIHTTAGGTAFGFHKYLLLDDDTYSHSSDYVYRTNAYIDESVTPPTTLHLLFSDLKYKFNKGSNEDCIIVYTNSNGDKYKLPAVKLTSTEIIFSVYDPDTARNLSIVVNDQDQYTVIT